MNQKLVCKDKRCMKRNIKNLKINIINYNKIIKKIINYIKKIKFNQQIKKKIN